MIIRNKHFIHMQKLILSILMIVSFSGCKDIKILNYFNDDAPKTSTNEPAYLNGINIMDLGMSGNVIPGVYNTNYTKPSLSTLQFLKSRGNKVVRIPFLWERVQPTLGGALNATYLGYIIDVLKDANTAGLKVIIDMHNYGRFESSGTLLVFGTDTGPTVNQYKDVWTKLTNAINAEPQAAAAIYAYDIMNEPHDLPDTRGSIDPAGASPIATFAADIETWEKLWEPTATMTHSNRNGGSLQVDSTAGAAGFAAIGAIRKSFVTFSSAAGSTIRVRGHLPANVQGDNPRIRLGLYHPWTVVDLTIVNVTKGQDFEFFFTPTAGEWAVAEGIAVELLLDNIDGNGPYRFYIDDVSQGALIAGKAPAALWEEYSQGAVDAIRATGDTKKIMIQGYDYSSAYMWATNHPVKWINDPANKIIYSAHAYFDSDRSGTYNNNFAYEVNQATVVQSHASVSARSINIVKVFTDWVAAQGVTGQIGEIGWPNSATNTDSASWDVVGDDVLNYLDSRNIGYTLWATGSWLGPTDNNLNAYDISTSTPLSPALILEQHL